MRIVATSDTHHPPDVSKIPNGDVFVHAGDLMRTGYPDEWQGMLDWLEALPHEQKVFVPGNHDFHLQVYPGPALQDLRRIGVTVVGFPGNHHFQKIQLLNGMTIAGLPYVTGLPRWAFNIEQEKLRDVLWGIGKVDIMVSHMPVAHILDWNGKEHLGEDVYRYFLISEKDKRPAHWINGHIHEAYGTHEEFDCKFYNVAMCNRDYVHANAPMVIDV